MSRSPSLTVPATPSPAPDRPARPTRRPLARAGLLTLASLCLLGTLLAPPAAAQTVPPAQPQQQPLVCNGSASGQMVWPAINVSPEIAYYPFEAEAGQRARIQLDLRGPQWFYQVATAVLYNSRRAAMFPDFNGYYLLPESGTYNVGIYGVVNRDEFASVPVGKGTVMPYTIQLRCLPPDPTPNPIPAP